MREIKEQYEIDLIQKAIDITIKGIESIMKNAKAGMMEYEMEAYFDFVLKTKWHKTKSISKHCSSREKMAQYCTIWKITVKQKKAI